MTTTGDTDPTRDELPAPAGSFPSVDEALEDLEARRAPTRDELMAATGELAPVEPAPPRAEPADPTLVSILTNRIGFELCHADGRPREFADDGNVKIEVSEEELVRHRSAAVAVIRELEELGRLAPAPAPVEDDRPFGDWNLDVRVPFARRRAGRIAFVWNDDPIPAEERVTVQDLVDAGYRLNPDDLTLEVRP